MILYLSFLSISISPLAPISLTIAIVDAGDCVTIIVPAIMDIENLQPEFGISEIYGI